MITWSREYDTGIKSIDEAHRGLVTGLNDLEQALASGAGSKRVPGLLAMLEKYASEHFLNEEACMSRYKCPTAQANKEAHRDFISRLISTRERYTSSSAAGALLAVQMHRELCDWIVNHILRVDSALKTCHPESKGLAAK